MKAGHYKSIPAAMVFRKHYCRKCGKKLCRMPHKRLVSPKDPEWKEYSDMGSGHILPIGNIEVTKYKFVCTKCEVVTEYEEQVVIRTIQKERRNNLLSDAELEENREWATDVVKRNRKILNVFSRIIWILAIACVMFYILRGGSIEITF